MPFVKVGSLAALAPGSVMEAEVNGSAYAVCNTAGELRAFEGVCPHAGGPLGQGMIEGNKLVCPWHGWQYDPKTGEAAHNPNARVAVYPLKVENGDVMIEV